MSTTASALPPRRPLSALAIAVQQAWVLIASLQITLSTVAAVAPPSPLTDPFLEWDAVMCYATTSLGVLWLIDLARTKTTSVDGCVKVVGKILLVLWLALVR